MIFVTLWAFLVLLGLLAYCCWSDLGRLKIPNNIIVMIIVFFGIAKASAPEVFFPLWQHVSALIFMFVITYIMFARNMMGGGDAKLISAVSLWIGLKGLLAFVVYMGIVGGILGVIALWLQKKKPFAAPRAGGWVEAVQSGQNAVPYGIAIAAGTVMAFSYMGIYGHILDEINKIIP